MIGGKVGCIGNERDRDVLEREKVALGSENDLHFEKFVDD
jgi:hypothetical protein